MQGFPGGPVVKNLPSNARDIVWTLFWEDSASHRATKPAHHNCWACTLEPWSHSFWGCVQQAEVRAPSSLCPRPPSPWRVQRELLGRQDEGRSPAGSLLNLGIILLLLFSTSPASECGTVNSWPTSAQWRAQKKLMWLCLTTSWRVF